MDTPLLVIGALLILTLISFFSGFLPYRIGLCGLPRPMALPQGPVKTGRSLRVWGVRRVSAALGCRVALTNGPGEGRAQWPMLMVEGSRWKRSSPGC